VTARERMQTVAAPIGRAARRVQGWVQDWPWVVNGVALAAVVAYWVSTWRWRGVSAPRLLDAGASDAEVMTLHLGVAALAAMVAGFSGVVVIFGLSGDSKRMRRLRDLGGDRLQANWTSVVAVAFSGAFIAVICAGLALGGLPEPSLWVGMYAVLLTGHGSLRLIWLLQTLARIVRTEDQVRARQAREIDAATLVPQRRAG
jgi:hypothetical protein